MTSSVVLGRLLTLETLPVEVFSSVDGQGKPTYDTPVDIEARVLRQDKFVTLANGSQLRTQLTVWVPPDAIVIPGERDRLEWDDELFIVVLFKEVKNRDAAVTHYRLRCRRE
jgi:hypothetical protein